MKYRAEIDGLRALAVVPVIFFHAGFELFSGGFVGVDVFFVISGYLITTILIEDIENKQFSIANFYERRARRILPALFLVMLACIPFAWVWMIPSQMEDFSASIFSISLFLSNLYFMFEVDYFAPSGELSPLLHTWSLSVEEQFYLFFPPLLLLFFKRSRRFAFIALLVIAAFSFAFSEWAWREFPDKTFYFSLSRFWELFVGSVAAFIVQRKGVQKNNALALLGLFAILFSIFGYDKATPFPSVYALVPVLGAVLLVLYADKETLTAKLLSRRVFVGIGLISYSAYLWHQPLFAFARIRSLNHPSEFVMAFLSLFSIALAYLSWKYVEKPFRNTDSFQAKQIFIGSLVGLIGFSSFSLVGYFGGGLPSRLPSELQSALGGIDDSTHTLRGKGCHLNAEIPKQPISACGINLEDGSADILLIGDSHLDAIGHQIQQKLDTLDLSSYALSYSGCVPISGLSRADEDASFKCVEYNEKVRQYARDHNVKTIILVGRFPFYLSGNRYDNGEGGVEEGDPGPVDSMNNLNRNTTSDDVARQNRVSEIYKLEIESLLEDFKVVVFAPSPEVGWHVPNYFSRLVMRSNMEDISSVSVTHSFDKYRQRVAPFMEMLSSIQHQNLSVYDFSPLFCDADTRRCRANDGRKLLYRDDDHLTLYAAELVAQDFITSFGDRLQGEP